MGRDAPGASGRATLGCVGHPLAQARTKPFVSLAYKSLQDFFRKTRKGVNRG
jgi:hypothetical protein